MYEGVYTNKHLIIVEGLKLDKKIHNYTCHCGKIYNSNSGLWKHNKYCKININEKNINEENSNEENINSIIKNIDNEENNLISLHEKTDTELKQLTNLVFEVVKNNQDFQKQMFEMCKTIQSNITMNNNCTTYSL
jgi:hypothetical protein